MLFSGKVSRDMSLNHRKAIVTLKKNVKDGENCPCAKFRFNFIIVARNVANKHFSLKKVPDSDLKHFETIRCRKIVLKLNNPVAKNQKKTQCEKKIRFLGIKSFYITTIRNNEMYTRKSETSDILEISNRR